ncbi:MAG: tetratricopeptide repeat protein [Planctomycetes bacterium]|nr:tetratricopeptide repeat protein [Planctomycetota bacterium]
MSRRHFNWKLAIILLIGLVVLGVTAFGLRRWQRSRRAEQGLVLGNQAYDEYNWEEAAKNLGRYVAVVQDDVPALLKYADAQLNIRPLKRNNLQQAIATYRTILRIDKRNSEAALILVEIYLQMGMSGEAELIAVRALEENSTLQKKSKMGTQTKQFLELRRMLAVTLASQRKFKEATKELKEIIKEHPEQILAYELLGQLIEQRPEDYSQKPLFWFDEAVKNNPSTAQAYLIRGAYHLRHGDKAKNIADLEQAEQQDLSEPAVRLRLAREFINANVFDKAEKHLLAVQKIEPANQILWQTWAQLALKSGSKTTMSKVAETGLKELSFQPWDFMPTAAELYIKCDELNLASDCINKLRQNDIMPTTTAFLEGLVADRKGYHYEAVKCWYKAMQLGDKSPRIRLALASTLTRLDDTLSALHQAQTLLSENPDFMGGRLLLARLLAQTGNWTEAKEYARQAMQFSPTNFEATLLYLQARIQLLATNETDKDSQVWQDVEQQLATLENATDGSLEVKLLQFQLAMLQKNFAGAETLVSELKKNHPSQIGVAIAEIELLRATNKIDEAILRLQDIAKEFPDSIQPVRYLAILLSQQGNYKESEKIIKDTLARIEQPIAQRKLGLLLAELYTRWGQRDNVYSLLNSLAQKLPDDIPIRKRLLSCEQIIETSEKTQQLVDDIRSLEGEGGWQWRYEQAKIWFVQDSFKDHCPHIISLLKENLLANPDDQSSRTLLAATYEKADRLPLAISTYREALNRSPQDLRIIIPAVAVLYKANEYNQADEILRQTANQKLYHPGLKKLELQSHLKRGQLSSASDILEDLLTNDPNNRSIYLTLALLKMRQDKFIEADKLLSKLESEEPNSLPVTVAQIELNVRQGKSTEAISLCDEIVNKFNNASAYILRARTFVSLKQAEKAEKDFEQATVIEPNNAESWTAKSDFYRSIGQYDIAIADIEKAMSLAPENLTIQKRVIQLFFVSGDRDRTNKGNDILDNALTANPEDIELRLYKSRFLLAEGTSPAIEQATSILQKITKDQPNLSKAWTLLAQIALRQGQSIEALDITLRGLIHRPNNKSLLLLKARLEAVRSPALAIPTLKALRERYPNDTDIVIHLANTYITANQSTKAVSLLNSQLASSNGTPDEQRIHISLAVALYKNGNKAEAQEKFHSLQQSAPDDPGPLLAQAGLLKDEELWTQLSQMVLHWCQNHPEDAYTPHTIASNLAANENSQAKKIAEDLLRRILNHDPDSLPAMKTLAMLLQITGHSTEAATLYQRILTFQSDNVIAINNLAWILCDEQGKYQQALELAQRGLRFAPDYVDLIDTRGVLYDKLGQYDKAIKDFNRCLELYPDRTPAKVASYLHLGKALAKLGQKDKAIESLKEAIKLNTEIGGLSEIEHADAQGLVEKLLKGL